MPEDTDLPPAADPATAYVHPDKRKNIPRAGMPVKNKVKEQAKHRYEYDPHLPPVLRFDSSEASKNSDRLPELLQAAQQRQLTADEVDLLAKAHGSVEPWLEWSEKREAKERIAIMVIDPRGNEVMRVLSLDKNLS